MKAGMQFEPFLHRLGFVRAVVVGDAMKIQVFGRVAVDGLEKLQPLLMPVARRSLGQDLAIEIIQRGKEGNGAMPVIVMRARGQVPLAQGQPRLRSFQRLALAMGLVREPSKDAEIDASMALRELSGPMRRLLIPDNAPNEDAIQAWIPPVWAVPDIDHFTLCGLVR